MIMKSISIPIATLVVLLLLPAAGSGQELERILVPLTPGLVLPGAHGSEWHTDLIITNVGITPLPVSGYTSSTFCPVMCPGPPPPIPPNVSVFVEETVGCEETRGIYLSVERSRSDDLVVSLRSRDMSRRLETWGTTIPVVRSSELFGTTFGINDIPMELQFRSTLRVYKVDPSGGTVVLRFYETMTEPRRRWPTFPNSNPDRLLLELRPAFLVPQSGGGTSSCPSFFEIALDQYAELRGIPRVRIEIDPQDGRTAYWAFVSTTHNTTQHVTVMPPE